MSDRLSTSNVIWPDAQLESVELTYDSVTLRLTQSNGLRLAVTCNGHIYLAVAGFWDNTLILDAETKTADETISMAVQLIADKSRHESGNPDRNTKEFRLLRVTFEDLGRLECVAASFDVEVTR